MKKIIVSILLVAFVVVGAFASGSIRPFVGAGAMINSQSDYLLYDLVKAEKAISVYGLVSAGVEVDIIDGFGVGGSVIGNLPISVSADGVDQEGKKSLGLGLHLFYEHDFNDEFSLSIGAGARMFSVPISKVETTTDGTATIETTYADSLMLSVWYGAVKAKYAISEKFRIGASVEVGAIIPGQLRSTVRTTDAGVTTTTTALTDVKQSGLSITPSIFVQYRF